MTVIQAPFPLSWAQQLIENADGPVPEYGSAEWIRLSDESRAKVASCVVAAEKWRTRRYSFGEAPSSSAWAKRIEEARRPRPGDHPGGAVPWNRDEVAADG